jgi:hypothetical protein
MFGKKKSNPVCPIDEQTRLWLENSFLWLAGQFGQHNIQTKKILLPTKECFPISYDGSKQSLVQTASIVAAQMELNIAEINLDLFRDSIQEFQGDLGHRIFTETDKNSSSGMSGGIYFGKNEDNKYDVFIEETKLTDPEALVAVLSHEFSHIKILGEERLKSNDELLTDLLTVVFGLGIFNANCAFREIKTFDTRGHNSLGYLTQQEWGYALALYAFFRDEKNPDWIKLLNPNIKSDFKKSEIFIVANSDKVFWQDYDGSQIDH